MTTGKTNYFLLVTLLLSVSSAAVTLWPHDLNGEAVVNSRRLLDDEVPLNPRLATVVSAFHFRADFTTEALKEGTEVEFGIPTDNGDLEKKGCVLKSGNPTVPLALQKKFENDFQIFHCVNEDLETLDLLVDPSRVDGMSASFHGRGKKTFYIDSSVKGTDKYILYNTAQAFAEGVAPEIIKDIVLDEGAYLDDSEIDENSLDEGRRLGFSQRRLQGRFNIYKFVLAPLANPQYTNFHGNTVASALQAVIVCFTRVNGVYTNEFGVLFELHPDTDQAICTTSDAREGCDIPNDTGALNVGLARLASLGLASNTYDVGHVLTTGSGGVAGLGVLCSSTQKARGTTGLRTPVNDLFFIDFVAHELGHQCLGRHIFRDCDGVGDPNVSPSSAVEPGSGSSIMGYAGICGGNNIQSNSDPYFNALNLQQMREHFDSRASCADVTTGRVPPAVSSVNTCRVPIGNNFELKGSTASSPTSGSSFSWDRVDPGEEDLDSRTLGTFRSWKPTESRSRFFPNLYHLTFPTPSLDEVENLPTFVRTMIFRFTERSLFEADAQSAPGVTAVFGDFSQTDSRVSFENLPRLRISSHSSGNTIRSSENTVISWDSGSALNALTVEVLYAENFLTRVNNFDYEVHNPDLDWKTLGSATFSNRQLTVQIPDDMVGKNLALMIRASFDADIESCNFFDFIPSLNVVQGTFDPNAPSPSPAPSPSSGGFVFEDNIVLIGGVVGALVLITLIAGFLYKTVKSRGNVSTTNVRRRKKSKKHQPAIQPTADSNPVFYNTNSYTTNQQQVGFQQNQPQWGQQQQQQDQQWRQPQQSWNRPQQSWNQPQSQQQWQQPQQPSFTPSKNFGNTQQYYPSSQNYNQINRML